MRRPASSPGRLLETAGNGCSRQMIILKDITRLTAPLILYIKNRVQKYTIQKLVHSPNFAKRTVPKGESPTMQKGPSLMTEYRGMIFTPECKFAPGVINVEGRTIAEVKLLAEEDLYQDERDTYIIPGLIDIHMHGCNGHDACESTEDGIRAIISYELDHGITSLCLATMTLPEDKLHSVLHNIASVDHSNLKGIYLEGPFIAEEKKGAQNVDYIAVPNHDMLRRFNESAQEKIVMVTIAPEVDGAFTCMEKSAYEFRFSIAHSDADYQVAERAFKAGVKHVTHLYNAMSSYSHRSPGIVGAAADHEDVMVELITDGIHIHPSVVRNTFKMFGSDRIVLVSDSMEATGMPNGTYSLGGQSVHVSNRWALLDDGTIAGSASNLYDCMIAAIKMGVPREDVIKAATINPAKAIDIDRRVGSLEVGKDADILILNHDFELVSVIQGEM